MGLMQASLTWKTGESGLDAWGVSGADSWGSLNPQAAQWVLCLFCDMCRHSITKC